MSFKLIWQPPMPATDPQNDQNDQNGRRASQLITPFNQTVED